MILRICPEQRCPNTQPCNEHPPGGWAPDHIRGTSTERGYGTHWRKLRKQVLADQRGRCECGNPATDVDHITPKAQGGTDHRNNLRALCQPCHHTHTLNAAAQGRKQ